MTQTKRTWTDARDANRCVHVITLRDKSLATCGRRYSEEERATTGRYLCKQHGRMAAREDVRRATHLVELIATRSGEVLEQARLGRWNSCEPVSQWVENRRCSISQVPDNSRPDGTARYVIRIIELATGATRHVSTHRQDVVADMDARIAAARAERQETQ